MERQQTAPAAPSLRAKLTALLHALRHSDAARRIGHTFLSFLLSYARLTPDAAPFALAYSASLPLGDALFGFAGAFAGYLMQFGAHGLVYGAAVVICCTARSVLPRRGLGGHPAVMPACVAITLICVRLPFAVEGGIRQILLLLCEGVLGGVFCYLFACRDASTHRRAAARLLLVVALALAFYDARIGSLLSPSRIFALVAVMLLSKAGGAASGVVFGAAFDLSGGISPFFAVTYGIPAVLARFVPRDSRIACAATFLVTNVVAALCFLPDARALPSVYEGAIAAAVFGVLPERALAWAAGQIPPRPARAGSISPSAHPLGGDRLREVARAFSELARSVSTVEPAPLPTLPELFDAAADRVCRRCALIGECWGRDALTTHDAFNATGATLKARGRVEPQDFPPYFAARCVNLSHLCGAINDGWSEFLRARAMRRREEDSKKLLREQYHSMYEVLSGVAAREQDAESDAAFSARVRRVVRAYTPHAASSVYLDRGRMVVEVSTVGDEPPLPDLDAFTQSLSLSLGRSFAAPEEIRTAQGRAIRLRERERFAVNICSAVRKKHAAEVCGDSNLRFCTDDGRAIIMLSDGMGTGAHAGAAASNALALIERFARSGCSLTDSARAVVPALAARFADAGFVTLDLLEIDLFSGEAHLLKYGAAPSFAVRHGKVQRYCSVALPAGVADVLCEPPEPAILKLGDGDSLILLSDGVCDGTDCAPAEALCATRDLSPQALASALLELNGGRKNADDMSVLVVSISAISVA